MSQSDEDIESDGGIEEMDIFGPGAETSDIRVSPGDRFSRMLDQYLYAPMRVAWHDWRARIGTMVILFYVLMGTVGVAFVRKPQLNEGGIFVQPFTNPQFPLGTDKMGQDILRQIIHATPAMLKMALAGVVFSAGVAVIIGVIAGYKGGLIDKVLMTFADIILTLPGLPLIIVIAAIYPPRDPFMVGVIIAIDSWPGLARALRSQVLTIREASYVESARAMGMPTSMIINREIIPQLMPYITINAAMSAAGVIGASVGLYFLGILPFTTLNWGVMMNLAHTTGGALANPTYSGHWLFFPALALSGLMFGLVLFSQGMDRVFNPRLRARHAKTIADEADDAEDTTTSTKSVTMTQK